MLTLTSDNASDDQTMSLEELFSELYNIDDRPFYFSGLTFAQLPQHAQHFLLKNGFVIDETEQRGGLSQEKLDAHFDQLLKVREAELFVLERSTCGVHREIVSQMSTLPPGELCNTNDDDNDDNKEAVEKLRKVLIPEWRGHLDECLDRIDALIWFEIEMRKGSAFEMQPAFYLRDRMDDAKIMVQFVAQHLQLAKEQMARETLAEELLVQHESNTAGQAEGSEPDTSDESASDSNTSSGNNSDYDECLFSESDYSISCHDISYDSDSESRSYWQDLNISRMAFKTRVV